MQLQTTVDDWCHGTRGAHVGVHLLVHQPEGQSFISNQSLQRWVMFFIISQSEIMQTRFTLLSIEACRK